MHHGLYDVVDGTRLHGLAAQARTMDELLRFGGLTHVDPTARVLDVGCGIGGASRYLARIAGGKCDVVGITLSAEQARRATELNREFGLHGCVRNEVVNVFDNDFADGEFDVVWSLESAEHMASKFGFLQECVRVLKPGGRMMMLAWCLRESSPPLNIRERYSIRSIMDEYCLPRMAPPSEYVTEMVRAGLRQVKCEDWTERAAPFWWEVARSIVFNARGLCALRKYGWPLIRSALAMRHVIRGIRLGAFRLVAFSGRLPTDDEAKLEEEKRVVC